MKQTVLTPGKLLDAHGRLAQAGYATSPVRSYDRGAIRAGRLRIKEWDYYLVYNESFGVALTLADNAYMGLVSVSFLDFERGAEQTVSPMFLFPMGRTGLPSASDRGDVRKAMRGASLSFSHEEGGRRLVAQIDRFPDGQPFACDLLLFDEPQDSMVIATPFPEKPTAFYYNQKIIGMRASGSVTCGGVTRTVSPEDSFGLLDWGRGVWTYENTWYWGAAQGLVQGRVVGFNIGYGFGDTSAATENMLFVDGRAHKLDRLTFHIPVDADGKEDYLSPWSFTSCDGRFEMAFEPLLDRAACTRAACLVSDQHQVFGHYTGRALLDDGTELYLKDFLGFAEKVYNNGERTADETGHLGLERHAARRYAAVLPHRQRHARGAGHVPHGGCGGIPARVPLPGDRILPGDGLHV